MFRRATCALLASWLCLWALPHAVQGQEKPQDQTPRLTAVRASGPIVVDGQLDEADWAQATVVRDLRVSEPIEGAPLDQPTEIRILYDDDALYFGVRAYDEDPSAIIATALRRDSNQRGDDRFMIVLDTFHERRSGYVFTVNPNGARWDALMEDNGGFNMQWDGIWYARAEIDNGGWSGEVAIPFKTLNFDPLSTVWGLNVARGIPRVNQTGQWANPDRDSFVFDVARAGDLDGLEGLEQGLGLDVIPALAIRQVRNNTKDRISHKIDPTMDVFYKLTPSLTGVLTANTDFSDAPPDRRRANLTRFSLFFPEQRDFFLQDSGIFRFGDFGQRGPEGSPPRVNGQPFFSRRIGLNQEGPLDIRLGSKLTGRIGRVNLGLFSTRVEGYQHPDTLERIDGKWLSVGRAFLNIFEESTVGVIATYGHPSENVHNKLYGADFNYRNTRLFGSRNLEGKLWVQKTSSSGLHDKEAAFGARLSYPNDIWQWEIGAVEIQQNFNPALGFANRTAIREYTAKLRHRWRPGGNIRTIDVGIAPRLVTGTDDDLQTIEVDLDAFELQTEIGDRLRLRGTYRREDLLEDFEIRPGIVIPKDHYRFERISANLQSSRNRPIEFGLRLEYGEFFTGTRFDVITRLDWKPNRHVFLSGEYEQFQVRLPEGDFTTRIARLSADFAFSPWLSFTNLIQWDNETDDAAWSSRLRWIIEPGRELVLVFDPFFRRTDRLKLHSTRTESVVKLLWTLRF